MTIPASAIPKQITPPHVKTQFTDKDGNLTNPARQSLQQIHGYVKNMCRIFPCNASTTSNVITLTLLNVQPDLTQYADFDSFGFIADANSTGLLTALVVTSSGSLATIKVFKNNGGTQATSGDITAGRQYFLTFVDSLDSGNGGFVLR